MSFQRSSHPFDFKLLAASPFSSPLLPPQIITKVLRVGIIEQEKMPVNAYFSTFFGISVSCVFFIFCIQNVVLGRKIFFTFFIRQVAAHVFLFRSAHLFSKGSLAFFCGTEQSENILDGYFPPYSYELSGLVVRSSCLEKSCESLRKNGARRSQKKHTQPPDTKRRDKRTVLLSSKWL